MSNNENTAAINPNRSSAAHVDVLVRALVPGMVDSQGVEILSAPRRDRGHSVVTMTGGIITPAAHEWHVDTNRGLCRFPLAHRWCGIRKDSL